MSNPSTSSKEVSCVGCGRVVYDAPEITSAIETNLREIHALRARCAALRSGLTEDMQNLVSDENYLLQQKQIYFQRMKRTLRLKMIELIQTLDSKKIKLAERNMELEQQRQTLEMLTAENENILAEKRIQELAIDSLNTNNRGVTYQYLSALRFRECVTLFLQYAISPHMPTRETDAGSRSKQILSGCSSVMSIPLPNSSNYEGVPAEIIVTALAHIGHLTSTLANILNIHLPYPIAAYESHEYATIASYNDIRRTVALTPSFIGGSPDPLAPGEYLFMPHSYGDASLDERHVNSEFSNALASLQHDVTILCIGAGVPKLQLYPAEAMLLNLHVLHCYCNDQARRLSHWLKCDYNVPLPSEFQTQSDRPFMSNSTGSLDQELMPDAESDESEEWDIVHRHL